MSNNNVVIMYTASVCPYCNKAKALLENKNLDVTEINIDDDPHIREKMIQKTNRRTVPQIFINEHHVGGCDDLYALERKGELEKLLK